MKSKHVYSSSLRLGIDLGGTKIEIAALDRNNKIILRKRIPTPQGNYGKTISAVVDLIAGAETKLGKKKLPVGVAIPGSISPVTNLIQNSNSVVLIGKPFHTDLMQAIGRTLHFENDANCFAFSEAVDGAASTQSVVFGVIIGTGTGAGIVFNKKIHAGPNKIAGEWGHNPMPWPSDEEWPGPKCYCGKTGCIESFLSGPGISRDHFEATRENLTAFEIFKRANEQSSTNSMATVERYERRLAKALANVINLLDPDAIVLGGGLSNERRLYKNVPKLWEKFVFTKAKPRTRLLKAKFGDSSGVRGAAWLPSLNRFKKN